MLLPEGSSVFEIVFSKYVVFTAFKIALIVGTILAFINHGQSIFTNTLTLEQGIKILVTYLVPYSVSSYSSFKSIRYIINKG